MLDPLPDHTIRISPRAKHPRLTISHRHGLVVVIPKRFSRRKVPAILRTNRQWIDRHLADLADRHEKDNPNALPDRISLKTINQEWAVTYRRSDCVAVMTAEGPADKLHVTGAVGDIEAVQESLRRWLKRKAKTHLIPRLHELSHRVGLPFGSTRVGLPSTRWASCSAHHTISLSAAMLFLPPVLADYILIHELCHVAHPNHSSTFWSLVARHIPDLPAIRRHLRSARQHVPAWAEA